MKYSHAVQPESRVVGRCRAVLRGIARMAVSCSLLVVPSLAAMAQNLKLDTLTVAISFRQSHSTLDLGFMGNKEALDSFAKAYNSHPHKVSTIHIKGYASPEGTVAINRRLSRERAAVIVNYLKNNCNIAADSIVSVPIGVDWEDLYTAVQADPEVPGREKALDIIANVTDIVRNSRGVLVSQRNQMLKRIEGGRTWSYMLNRIYPYLRGAKAEVVCVMELPEPQPVEVLAKTETPVDAQLFDRTPTPTACQYEDSLTSSATVYWSLHTNALYDLVAIPNLGAELYLGKHFSIAANWWYAWWKTDSKHRYWRTYGGYIAPRYWLGKAAAAKPLTGHHLGLYAQVMLYDFEWGGTGYLSGTPYKNISHRPTWGGGIEYGFALPIQRRLNIDFTIGLGYLKGRYWKYVPLDEGYRWISVNNLNWWGPTKCEASLVWLLGDGNSNNIKKGGRK